LNPHTHARRRALRRVAVATSVLTTATASGLSTPAAGEVEPSVRMAGTRGADRVAYGSRIRVRGEVVPREPGRPVALQHALRGRGFRTIARASTDARGGYRFSVRARHSGAYRAVADGRRRSALRRVTVVARLRARAQRHTRRGRRVRVRGLLRPGVSGRIVRLQVRTRRGWRTVDRARTRRSGRFRAAWRASRPGRYRLRVRFRGDRRNAGVTRRVRGRVYVYRRGRASWYGPGFYGSRTACGRRLGTRTLGVAHRRLRCGTRVTFRYRGRTVTVPVIDRGPYAGGREWDLTAATKRRLRFPSTGVVWSTR
jgi:rare lipoprotein A